MIKVGGGGVQGPVFLTFFFCNSAGLVKLNKKCCLVTVVRIIYSTEALLAFQLIIFSCKSGFLVVGCCCRPYAKYGGRSPKFFWAPCHVMCTAVPIG